MEACRWINSDGRVDIVFPTNNEHNFVPEIFEEHSERREDNRVAHHRRAEAYDLTHCEWSQA